MSKETFSQDLELDRTKRHRKGKRKKRKIMIAFASFVFIASLSIAIPLFSSANKVAGNELKVYTEHSFAQGYSDEHQLGKKAIEKWQMTEKENKAEKDLSTNKKEKSDNQEKETIVKADVNKKEKANEEKMVGDEGKKITQVKNDLQSDSEKRKEESVEATSIVIHEVKPNDTLYSITMRYFSNSSQMDKIAKYNGIENPERDLKVGTRITIPDPEFMMSHTVVKGETLFSISKHYYGAPDYAYLLAQYNGLSNPNEVKLNATLEIPNTSELMQLTPVQEKEEPKQSNDEDYRIVINKNTNKLVLYKGDTTVKSFSVGTGKDPSKTPEGEFKIVTKIVEPWYSTKNIAGGDPQNPLGSRWLGLDVPGTSGTTYGIHGTNDPSSIGKHVSAGCIRMLNSDVEWLYNQLPLETSVTVVSQ